MKTNRIRFILFFFSFSTFAFFIFKSKWIDWGFDVNVLYAGNFILFLASFISLYFHIKAMHTTNAMKSVRQVTASTMLKLLICATAALLYIFINKSNVNKPSLIACFVLYAIYSTLEVRAAMK